MAQPGQETTRQLTRLRWRTTIVRVSTESLGLCVDVFYIRFRLCNFREPAAERKQRCDARLELGTRLTTASCVNTPQSLVFSIFSSGLPVFQSPSSGVPSRILSSTSRWAKRSRSQPTSALSLSMASPTRRVRSGSASDSCRTCIARRRARDRGE